MRSQNNTCRSLEISPASTGSQTVDPDMELSVAAETGFDTEAAAPYGPDGVCAAPEGASTFVKGLTIALPLSISLWALIIMGLRAVF